MRDALDILFLRTWWSYECDGGLPYSAAYHWFNLFEGGVWLVFAALVLARFLRHRHSPLELWYAFAFVTFAVSDFREAWAQSSWLIWLKLFNLIALLWLRHVVMKRYYPLSRVY
jgi:hypothetical protein